MFHEEGGFVGKVTEIVFADPKFAKGADDFDVCLHIEKSDDPAQADWWRGEMSQNYGKGNFSTMTQAEITMQALHKVGFDGDDLSTLEDQFVGQEIPFCVRRAERDGKTYYNIHYIGAGGGDRPKPIDGDIKARMAALMGGESQAEQAEAPGTKPAAPKPASVKKNPFGK